MSTTRNPAFLTRVWSPSSNASSRIRTHKPPCCQSDAAATRQYPIQDIFIITIFLCHPVHQLPLFQIGKGESFFDMHTTSKASVRLSRWRPRTLLLQRGEHIAKNQTLFQMFDCLFRFKTYFQSLITHCSSRTIAFSCVWCIAKGKEGSTPSMGVMSSNL